MDSTESQKHPQEDTEAIAVAFSMGASSGRGGRERNEDSYALGPTFACVSDGIGGASYGDVMSKLCCGKMRSELQRRGCASEEDMAELIDDVDQFASEAGEYLAGPVGGAGATLVCAALAPDCRHAIVGRVGDSMAYVLRRGAGSLEQAVGGSGRAGIPGEPANMLDAAMGIRTRMGKAPEPRCTTIALRPGDRLLLCSDGVWDQLTAQTIIDVLDEDASPRTIAAKLVDLAVDAKGARSDNATAVVVDIESAVVDGAPAAGTATWDADATLNFPGMDAEPLSQIDAPAPEADAGALPDEEVQTEDDGIACAVLSDNGCVLTFLRSSEACPDGSHLAFVLESGERIEGTVSGGFEEAPAFSPTSLPSFSTAAETARTVRIMMPLHPRSLAWWFKGFSALERIEGLELIDASQVSDMAGMFCGCSSLHALDLSALDAAHVTNMHCLLLGCSSLEELALPDCNGSMGNDMQSAFDLGNDGPYRRLTLTLKEVRIGPHFRLRDGEALPSPQGKGLTGRWCCPDGSHAMDGDEIAYTGRGSEMVLVPERKLSARLFGRSRHKR